MRMELIHGVIAWAAERGLLAPSKAEKQALKFFSEAGEMADNLIKGRDVRDDIGDILVTLIILADQCGTTLDECLTIAYNDIKNRTGQTVDGVFIKDGDNGAN